MARSSTHKIELGTGMNSRRRGVPSSEPARQERRDFVEYMQEYARQGKMEKEIVVVSAEELMEQGKPVDKATDFSAALAMAEASLQEPEEEEEIVEEEEVYDPGVFAPERWIIDINTCLYPTSRLILFHGIGQNFNFFKSWGPMFQTLNIALHSVCLPGRCHRINEPFCQVPDAAAYVVRVMEELHENGSNEEDQSKKGWKKVPTYLYGHCLGAIIAFEVAKTFTMQLSEKDHPNKDFFIQHLVVSSSRPPQLLSDGNKDRYAKNGQCKVILIS